MQVSAQRSRASWVILFYPPLGTQTAFILLDHHLLRHRPHMAETGSAPSLHPSLQQLQRESLLLAVFCLEEADQGITHITFPSCPMDLH